MTDVQSPLLSRIEDRSRRALSRGALRPIETDAFIIADGGVDFVVRMPENLRRKAAASKIKAGGRKFNPFLPHDPDLYVAEMGSSHLCLLNKFNVVDHHVLLVTRHYEDQEQLLGPADFAALWQCLDELDWLAFYNGGQTAGASQAHKHLQLVPPGIGAADTSIPMEAVFSVAQQAPGTARPGAMPFQHALFSLDARDRGATAARAALNAYLEGMAALGCGRPGEAHQIAPYNLLVTRRWLLLAPRREECYESMSVNALGFAGSLFVRSARQLEQVRSAGPMRILAHVGRPAAEH